MKLIAKNNFLSLSGFIFIIIFLSSCASIASMKFWESEDVENDEPRLLKSFTEKESLSINWMQSFEGKNKLGNFEPSFGSGKVFFADAEGDIRSLDPESGQINWTISSANEFSSGIVAGFNILAIADVNGNISLYDQDSGQLKWITNVKGEVLSAPAVSARFIIVKTGSGELIALDKNSGDIKWSYRSKLPTLTIRGSSSPVIIDNEVYASFDNGRIGVFDLDSGFPKWDGAISYVGGSSELESLIDSDSSPVIDDAYIYAANFQGNLTIFDKAQKRAVWQSEASSFYAPLLVKGLIVLVETNSSFKTFFNKGLQESWSLDEYQNRDLSNPVSFGGYIVVGDLDGYIHLINPLNGQTIGRKKISKHAIKTLISRSKNFYAVDESFNLYSLSI